MGSGGTNFYNEAFARLGYADEVAEVARLRAFELEPPSTGAIERMPDKEVRIVAGRLEQWREGDVDDPGRHPGAAGQRGSVA